MLYLQVDCAGALLLMTGSPHTSMPLAMHHFKPRRSFAGVFLCSELMVNRSREWRRRGGIDYQDTVQVYPCNLFLDFLSRKVLVVNTPTPASAIP